MLRISTQEDEEAAKIGRLVEINYNRGYETHVSVRCGTNRYHGPR